MGDYSQKAFTDSKLAKMGISRSAKETSSANDAKEDDYGMKAAGVSNGSEKFAEDGKMDSPDMKARTKDRLDRPAYKRGGAVKGKTTVNVIVGGQKPDPQPVPVPVPAGGPPVAPPMPMARPPMMPPGGAPMPPGAGMPPGGPMPMRARGGPVKMDAGAGSGVGRLEKERAAKKAGV